MLLSDFCNHEFLADVLLVVPHRLPVTVLLWEAGNRGTCCICMEELWRPLKRLNLCYTTVDAEILCISAEGFPCFTGFEGFPVLHCCVLGLESWALQQAECSERSQALQLQCPHRLYDSAQCCWWCLSKVALIALEQALMQNREPSGAMVQIVKSLYYVDVMGLPPTLPCPVANLLCQATGDNSDAIGRQLCFLTSGSGVQQ